MLSFQGTAVRENINVHPHFRYRPDVDGLRALAIVPVVLYHFGIPGVPGGFAGVDVFFVISGFLICGMIEADISRGTFTIGEFYRRRILRILPALLVMMTIASLAAYTFLLPEELKDYLRSLLSALGSVSNMYYAQTAGYFDAAAESKPLLHTWSLAVEEQFYLFAPLIILAIHRFFPQRKKVLLWSAVFLFFALEVAVYFRNPTFAFYLMPCRAWELGLGALLAIGAIRPPGTERGRNAAGMVGLALVGIAMLVESPFMPLPVVTLLASVGATLLIAAGSSGTSAISKLLSTRPLIFIGLISYSLYLWHWPIIAFQHTDLFLLESGSQAVVTAVLVALSFVVGWLSWRFVEAPFRRLKGMSKRHVFCGATIAVSALMALAGVGLALNGLPGRFPEQTAKLGSYLGYDPSVPFRTGRCFVDTNRQHYDAKYCLALDSSRKNYLLIGDSFAAHLWFGLSAALPRVNILQATASVCRPIIIKSSPFDTGFCPHMRRLVFDDFLSSHRVNKILLAASWKEDDIPALLKTIALLKARGFDVVVLGPLVEYQQSLPRILADQITYHAPRLAQSLRDPKIPPLDKKMGELVKQNGATYISLYAAACPQDLCEAFASDGVPLQFDAGHLTAAGSLKLGLQLAKAGQLF